MYAPELGGSPGILSLVARLEGKGMRAENCGGLAEALNPIPPRGLIKGFTEFRPLLLLRLSWASFQEWEKEGERGDAAQSTPFHPSSPSFIRQY